MKVAGIHLERLKAVIREKETDSISILTLSSIDEVLNSKEIKECNNIYINSGVENYLIKTESFTDRDPEDARWFILENLEKYVVEKSRREYQVRIAAMKKGIGSLGYIIEAKKKNITQNIKSLPIESYKISGIIPDNFAIAFPFIFHDEGKDFNILIAEIGDSSFMLTCIEKGLIVFTRNTTFNKKDFVGSLDKNIDIIFEKVCKIDTIYITGVLSNDKKENIFNKSKYRDILTEYSFKEKIPQDALLAYGLSVTPEVELDVDLTPHKIVEKRKEYEQDLKIKGWIKNISYILGILLFIPILFLISGKIWMYVFDKQIEKYSHSYENTRKLQKEVIDLQEKLRLRESTRTSISWVPFLVNISRIIPEDVRIISLESEPVILESGRSFKFHLIGEGNSQQSVMDFYSRIRELEIVKETNIEKVKNENGLTSYEFIVTIYP